jgi:hypothetical protein
MLLLPLPSAIGSSTMMLQLLFVHAAVAGQLPDNGFCLLRLPANCCAQLSCMSGTHCGTYLLIPLLYDCLVDFLALLLLFLQCLNAICQQRLLGFPARQLGANNWIVAGIRLKATAAAADAPVLTVAVIMPACA